MPQSIEESLLQAIKKDDTKEFNFLMEKAQCGEYRLGRFPVLSLLYLYKSRAILSEHEQDFLKITQFRQLREPAEISGKFSAKAGKCLRLYLNEVVTPLEMLLILDRTRRLKGIYPLTNPSAEVKQRLKLIYSIRYNLNVNFEGNEIIIDRRPLSYREKKNIATICLCCVLGVTLAVGVPVTTVALIPEPVEGEVKKLSQIDFSSQQEYTLKRDIVLPENYSVEQFNCTINGGGNKLILGKGVSLGELNGKLSDVIIESTGESLFTAVSVNAVIENITVNVSADLTAYGAAAFIAQTNYGTIDGVTLNVSGSIHAVTPTDGTEVTFGGLVLANDYKVSNMMIYRGVINNCTVNYSQFTVTGEAEANAAFGGVAGVNSGYVQDCTVTGRIVADTCDIAGVCVINNGMLTDCLNGAELSQTSSDTGWNPITCGIVLSNAYAVENCENRGAITAVSDCGEFVIEEGSGAAASAAGIAYLNRGSSATAYIKQCINSGNVSCSADYRNCYAAGVCISTSGGIESCENSGNVTVSARDGVETYAGGITSVAYGYIYKCVNTGGVSSSGGIAYAGGISAHSCSQFLNCYSGGDINVEAQTAYVGGIFGISEPTMYGFNSLYCGTAEYCISESKINVTATDTPSYVGGIAGFISEAEAYSGSSVMYIGGISHCYFTGECVTKNAYTGNIAGVCSEYIYLTDYYISGFNEYHNFDYNCYIENSFSAFGAILSADGEYSLAEDKGAEIVDAEEIKNSEGYISILSALEK